MKAYTDISQSKELAEFLPIESADAHYVREITDFMGNPVDGEWSESRLGNPENTNYIVQDLSAYELIPCWSLAALLDMFNDQAGLAKEYNSWFCYDNGKAHLTAHHINAIDAVFEMICWILEREKNY